MPPRPKTDNTAMRALKKSLKAGAPGQLYVFYGEEAYLRDYYVGQLKQALLPAGLEDFNLHTAQGKDCSAAWIEQAVDCLPMMSERTLILVTDFDLFGVGEKDREHLAALFADLPEYCCLVFAYDLLTYKADGRSKLAAAVKANGLTVNFQRQEYTAQMQLEGYTILAPQMSPIHFEILQPIFKKYGYNVVVLDNDDRSAIDTGLKYVNNDACFPSITVVGQIMEAVLSGKYDLDHLAVIMTQTGGCCRASNYVAFIRRALQKAGCPQIPVISVNANGMEKNQGFKFTPGLILDAIHAIVYGDLFMRCLYRVRPYELTPGSADALHEKWKQIAIDSLTDPKCKLSYAQVCRGIVEAFDAFPIDETLRKPRVGIVGEILVKYMPLANNHLVQVLEAEGAEAVVPDMLDFFNYCLLGGEYRHEFLGAGITADMLAKVGIKSIRAVRQPAIDALKKSRRFAPPVPIEKIAEATKPFLSLGNQYGEGWFLAGEMVELITSGTPNVICIQPFACLPNHVVGKGVIKVLKKAYPQANIAAVDYDPGASEVNQLNRIKLMLSAAKQNL